MVVWLEPVRRTLQNPGQTEATTPNNPAIGRRAQAKLARQPLQDTFWRRCSVNGTCARSPHRFAHYVVQMRVFAGKRVPRCGNADTVGRIIHRGGLSPLLSIRLSNRIRRVTPESVWSCGQQKRLQRWLQKADLIPIPFSAAHASRLCNRAEEYDHA